MEKIAFDIQSLANSALNQATSELSNFKDIKERPFEILFKYLAPGLMMLQGRWILGTILSASKDLIGIGIEDVGAWIDKLIGKGPNTGDVQVSDSSLMDAAKTVVNKLIGAISKSSAFQAELIRSGNLEYAIIAAWTAGPKLVKQAYGISTLKKFLAMNPRANFSISGLLYSLLKALLVGVAIRTGTGMIVGPKTQTAPTTQQKPQGVPSMRLYTNPFRSVEHSISMALDNTIKDKKGTPFSKLFEELKGYPLVGSSEMSRILGEVRAAHGGAEMNEIDQYKTFAAPPIADMAKILLPQATYSKKEDFEKSMESILGGKNAPMER